MRQSFVPIVALCISAGLSLPAADTLAQDASSPETVPTSMGWHEEDYPYLVVDQAVNDALLEFGYNLDVPIEISRKAGKKRVHRYDHDGSSGEFLSYLVSEHGLDWVFDGGRLFVSSVGERITRSWSGDAGALEVARDALAEAGIDDERYRIGIGSGQGVLSLTAPPRYMAQAVSVIESALTPRATQTVKVIHGRTRGGGT